MTAEVPNIRCNANVNIYKTEGVPTTVSASMLCVDCAIFTRDKSEITPVIFSGTRETVSGRIANIRFEKCKAVPPNTEKGNHNS